MRHGHADLRLLLINNIEKFIGSLDLTSGPLPMDQKIAVILLGIYDLPNNIAVIEDEYHFLLIFPLYNHIRLKFTKLSAAKMFTCSYICNELGKGRPRLETGTTDDGLLGFLKQQTQSGDGI